MAEKLFFAVVPLFAGVLVFLFIQQGQQISTLRHKVSLLVFILVESRMKETPERAAAIAKAVGELIVNGR